MTTREVRQKYLDFFSSKERGHRIISQAPLVLTEDPSTLFTSSGMQPLVPYLMGETHPEGKRVVNSQPSIRTQDIDEVGNSRHTTFFEMLGNWSFGDYFKKEQLGWLWEFLTKELGIPQEKLWVSVFEGNDNVPRDVESYEIWKSLGVPEERIRFYGVEKNWWSRAGVPEKMPAGEIGGPDSEVFFEFTEVKHDPAFGSECHPNCDCGRFFEIGNSVFIQYKKLSNGSLGELPQKNVDFGGGLERLVAVVNNESDIFKIDLFDKLIRDIEKQTSKKYSDDRPSFRIIADHIRASVFLAGSGVVPSNKQQGYVMRRLIRRSVVKARKLKNGIIEPDIFSNIVAEVMKSYEGVYFEGKKVSEIQKVIFDEVDRFYKTLDRGMREAGKIEQIDGVRAFDLYQTYGFPLEVTEEIFKEKGQKIDREVFESEFEKHKTLSRTASAGMFKGGLSDHTHEVTALHTATHLLHAALRKVLGEHVSQKGSNITKERLRFDFTHSEKLSDEEIGVIERIVNEEIEKDLAVTSEEMSLGEAKKRGALAFFGDKYDERVKVYTIGSLESPFSREVCGGPHIKRLSEIGGHVRIKKQEAVSSGVRRIYAVIVER
ncbi:hypothetical protein A2382_05025 [Candidatus Woesebacteria bacterium RIFOXYB1_FULL_38_16]|uniref:alanine--tRNA ligase n=1 Tax=Candidatus Woesebacteria bacterium RIFOXYB1_FULL_38_16 TaxID=1802538 RepID=A0A1F8CW38_9BACT|nr:MAG: hypothetical protein A2191_00135 [Candidatus Woesebacteria bacterium RIFOXYA1_FULL_38_9]OGM80019.1 MAG: hypothetical protein A2382_05025 [Candidatus Woesebacteria bacterium RIFOXYB1_FULL_38_16]